MRHPGRLGIVLRFDEGIGHCGEAEGAQAIDNGMNKHADLLINCSTAAADVGVEEDGHLLGGGAILSAPFLMMAATDFYERTLRRSARA